MRRHNCEFDEVSFIAHVLVDISMMHEEVYNLSHCERDFVFASQRCGVEGIDFLTKVCPALGKALDKALSGGDQFDATALGFPAKDGSRLPIFMGELFEQVLSENGTLLPCACTQIVRDIRQFCYLFYKYELGYTDEQEQSVLNKFERTEEELSSSPAQQRISELLDDPTCTPKRRRLDRSNDQGQTTPFGVAVRESKYLLARLFGSFDPKDIYPRHGPGAVAGKQKPWDKFRWKNVSARITQQYPLDAYFYASTGAVCDSIQEIQSLEQQDLPARVILVPKDSRGPRLISAEPVDFQWVQQGLGRAIVDLVERDPLTKWNVFFTDQAPNQRGALLGSATGRYATLDLNEASDRVSLSLVRLLFPEHVYTCLEACRSSSTVLPNGKELKLNKFAPMGSSLCFPILALTVWALLVGAAPDEDTMNGILVYGDDVIVPTAYAARAIEHLESFGLKVNQDKSCTSGLFRESCGIDAFKGESVTPVRFRTVWSSSRSANAYPSWVSYANSLWDRHYYCSYDYIVTRLHRIYGEIPSTDMHLACPSLQYVPGHLLPSHRRVRQDYQVLMYKVWSVRTPTVIREVPGWSKLLRWFSERSGPSWSRPQHGKGAVSILDSSNNEHLTVSEYTQRGSAKLIRCWRWASLLPNQKA